jgi:cytochrome P450
VQKGISLAIIKDDYLVAQFFASMHNPAFFPDPDNFNPSRWMQVQNISHPYAFCPFSAGPRNCIG